MSEHQPTLDIPVEARSFALELLLRCDFPRSSAELERDESSSDALKSEKQYVCAVSGGADSLALLVLARMSGLETTAVHVDHGLRTGSASESQVVRSAADRLGASFLSEFVVVEPGPDLEARARNARHKALAGAVPSALVFTGHTQDDQAETLLINLLRGTGVAGIAAMRPGGTHPILGLRRVETVELCRLCGLDPVQDPSNLDPRFVRNRVRNELLPLMRDISDRDVSPLLARTSDRAREIQDAIERLASPLDPTDTRMLRTVEPSLVAESLRKWLRDDQGHPPSAAELTRVLEVVHHRATSCQLSGGRTIRRTNGVLRIEVAEEPSS